MSKNILLGLMILAYCDMNTMPEQPLLSFIRKKAPLVLAEISTDVVTVALPVGACLLYIGTCIAEISNRFTHNRWLNKPLIKHKDGCYAFI